MVLLHLLHLILNFFFIEAWNQDPDVRISMSKLLIDLDNLAKKSVKPGCSPGLQPQEIVDSELENPLNNENDEIPEDKYFDFISIGESVESLKPMIPISEGVKAHKEGDYEKAWKCFNEQAENQNSVGKYWKAYYLYEGLFDQKIDKMTALTLYKEAADDGVVIAQYRYACALLVTSKSKSEAFKYLRMAAENGNAAAQFQVGEGYLRGKLGYNQNSEMAKLWYKRAALQNDKKAKERLKELKEDV